MFIDENFVLSSYKYTIYNIKVLKNDYIWKYCFVVQKNYLEFDEDQIVLRNNLNYFVSFLYNKDKFINNVKRHLKFLLMIYTWF